MKKNYLLVRGISIVLFSLFMFTNLSAQLYVNEFMASNDSACPGPQGDFPDWIEIYNNSGEDIMLGGYFLSDKLDDPEAMFQIPDTYPDSVTVPAGGFILFYANKGEESSVLNLDFKLSGGGEAVGLWTPESVFIDSLTYGNQNDDISYGRFPDGSDVWGFMTDYTPGTANTNPTPAAIELFINEFMASNDDALPGPEGDYPDWIEIYNAGEEAVMLGGYYMSDDLVDPEAMFQISDMYPDSVTVQPGDFILFYANKGEETSVLNLDFKLSGSGEQVGLWSPEQVFLDSITYGDQIADTSYGRYADGTDNWFMMPDYTPGAANIYTSSINEIVDNVSISQNFPNPFSTKTNIQFDLENADYVMINVYDLRGSLVAVLADGNYTTGSHTIIWDASEIPSGYYFYTLQTSTSVVTKKASIIR